jgi:hypothetical protein
VADDGLRRGARAYAVLDCIPLERDGIPFRRVIMRGVYADELDAPPPLEGAIRNVTGVFIGLDMQTPVFLIAYPREGGKGKSDG